MSKQKLFKVASFEQELLNSMQENLVSNQLEKKYSFDRIAKAADFIHSAAEIFDDTGFHAEAEVLTRILEKLSRTETKSFEAPEKVTVSLGDLSIDEIKFFQSLPIGVKKEMEKNVKQKGYELDVSDFVKNVKMMFSMHQEEAPKVFEYESLFHDPAKGPKDTASMSKDFIEFTSLPTMRVANSKKKV